MSLRVIPLGGLGEVGMNCMAIEVGRDDAGPIVIVDCGVLFPEAMRGIDVIHPSFSWLLERRERIAGLVVTHGHEDHIGAIPYLLAQIDLPVYAPPYALGLIRARLDEHRDRPGAPRWMRHPRLHATTPRTPFSLTLAGGAIEVEPVAVTHSIADATALAIRTEHGTILHTGDFKIDGSIGGLEAFDRERLAEIGDEGVELLLSDSTNVDVPGRAREEAAVAASLARIVSTCKQRVVVGLFASNVHRMRAIFEVARQNNRRVALAGRSMHLHLGVARETGHLNVPPDAMVSIDDAANLPPHEIMIVATGSQAEPRAALARLALDDHPRVRLSPGDAVILSSRTIPGHEIAVMRMISDFHRRGCEVHIAATDPDLHGSGHACREEQREMIDLIRPDAMVPIHGTRHHLERHAALARDAGVKSVVVIENGEVASLDGNARLEKMGTFASGRVAVDEGGPISDETIRERARLGEFGVAIASVVVDARGRPTQAPQISTYGVGGDDAGERLVEETAEAVERALANHPWTRERPTDEEIEEVTRVAARRAIARVTGRPSMSKPVGIALVSRVERR